MKEIFIALLILLCLACTSKEENVHTFDEFKDAFNVDLIQNQIQIGTCFWDEFGDMESQYGFAGNESKLFGKWYNMTFKGGPIYNYYTFFPNKLFIVSFNYKNIQVIDAKNLHLNKALGTWEIIDGIVKFTIYAIMTIDDEKSHPYNKDIFYVEHPYTIDFINIDDIDERGFTQRPINDMILSNELQKMVTIKNPNITNNLYVRNVYTINVVPEYKKNYGYFQYFPEMARENHSGLDIVMNPELIKKYIPDWMY